MKIIITENELRQIVNESVKRILNEDNNPYSEGGVNPIYGGLGRSYKEYTDTINRKRNWDSSPQHKEYLENRKNHNDFMQQREETYQGVEDAKILAKNMRNNVVNFYNTLRKYQNKGMLRKFFSSKPKFEDYGINTADLYKLKNVYRQYRDAINSVDSNIGSALNYFEHLRLI